IPELRRWLRDHFLENGRITDRKDLNLLYFSSYDLKLYAPSFTFRTPKRDMDDIAVFPAHSSDGVALIAPLNGITFSAPLEAGLGIVGLQKIVGSHLIRQGHLNSIYDMTIRKLDPALWELFRDYLSPHSSKLTYFRRTDDKLHRYGLDVFSRDGILYTARLNRLDRTTIYAAPTIQALKDKIGEDLVRYGAVNTINDIRAVSATDKPATSLMDTILHKPAFASR
ncbi:MAG TPA: hypothetical protein VI451_10835, partial [Anaerolineales bacterium]|nr:hypothetical protein [Anaerolineales bacterium]